jgi:hypothetical protein
MDGYIDGKVHQLAKGLADRPAVRGFSQLIESSNFRRDDDLAYLSPTASLQQHTCFFYRLIT